LPITTTHKTEHTSAPSLNTTQGNDTARVAVLRASLNHFWKTCRYFGASASFIH
jgi:hypothetical protein